ncbi:MAG: hypothetical protein LBJ11_10590 [Oscillospiraceae bacterium]|nr:hypothetical protein [Oscillospiraceae bacterium]
MQAKNWILGIAALGSMITNAIMAAHIIRRDAQEDARRETNRSTAQRKAPTKKRKR